MSVRRLVATVDMGIASPQSFPMLLIDGKCLAEIP